MTVFFYLCAFQTQKKIIYYPEIIAIKLKFYYETSTFFLGIIDILDCVDKHWEIKRIVYQGK